MQKIKEIRRKRGIVSVAICPFFCDVPRKQNPRSRLNLPEYGVREARLFHKIRDFVHRLYNRLNSYNMVSPFF